VARGAVAEWLGRGLQSLVHRFESGRRLIGSRFARPDGGSEHVYGLGVVAHTLVDRGVASGQVSAVALSIGRSTVEALPGAKTP
jgi:hypothetical protein